ncbi:MAG: hypothetical protein MUP70_10445, partial [Candidatus Aminicenantes bacterium]|nr:hypothetical protein [Candidatus Aminicenantes bacterium]
MRLFAVAGNPVLHSRSPFIFKNLFKTHSIDADSTRLHPENSAELFEMAECLGLEGLNITSPFKEPVFHSMDEWDEMSGLTNSVNTVILNGEKKKGRNTDPDGVSRTLTARGIEVRGKKALILGAGGAGRAAALALTRMGSNVVILNRTISRAEEYASKIRCRFSGLEDLDIHLKDAFLLVNTFPDFWSYLNIQTAVRPPVFFDAVYSHSPLKDQYRKTGAVFISGMEWLIHQAHRSFEMFTGINPDDREGLHGHLLNDNNTRVAKENIGLIGFMGCGKTSVGGRLARRRGWAFVDTDNEIEKAEKMSIQGKPFMEAVRAPKQVLNQVKKALEITVKLGGQGYVFWGGREGYETLLNTDLKFELDNMA